MIIQCGHCSAKFRIDDAKLANGPVKVRCAKCKEVFVVDKEESSESSLAPQAAASAPLSPPEFPGESAGEDIGFSFDQEQPSTVAATAVQSPAADEFDWKDAASSVSVPGPDASHGFDNGRSSLEQNSVEDTGGDFDFGDIDLQSSSADGKASAQPGTGDDFSLDFGEVSFAEPHLSLSSTPEPASEDMSAGFSFDEVTAPTAIPSSSGSDDFLLSFKADQSDEPKGAAGLAAAGESVNFGDFSFGEMDSDTKEEVSAARENESKADLKHSYVPAMDLSDEEPLPTSLPSRKKSGSRFPFILILGAIAIIVALAGSGLYFFGGAEAFSKFGLGFLVDWYGEKGAEEGSISIRNIQSSYVVNGNSGELFVVRGEAVNNFRKPRASIQVKVSVLGAGGAVIAGKTAFCGNSLSNEQLASLPLAKIEETMNNRFGDSLANLGVKPGSSIPFTLAISAVPKEATDFSVQVVGSTVATQ